jgi:hypothetical protein
LLKDFSGVEVVCAVWAITTLLAKRSIASEIQQQLDKRSIVKTPNVGLSGTEAWRLRAGAPHFRNEIYAVLVSSCRRRRPTNAFELTNLLSPVDSAKWTYQPIGD